MNSRLLSDGYENDNAMCSIFDTLLVANSAFYAMIETGNSEESFNFFLERNVATCPGSKFGPAADTALRISIAGNSDNLIRDFEILHNAYHEWRNK